MEIQPKKCDARWKLWMWPFQKCLDLQAKTSGSGDIGPWTSKATSSTHHYEVDHPHQSLGPAMRTRSAWLMCTYLWRAWQDRFKNMPATLTYNALFWRYEALKLSKSTKKGEKWAHFVRSWSILSQLGDQAQQMWHIWRAEILHFTNLPW